MQHVTVFCGASMGSRPEYGEAVRALGRALGERQLGLVYGGARTGLMGQVADAALEAGGFVTGVIPSGLVVHEVAHGGLSRLEIVDTMHERKAKMAALGDAFITLPGGFGTAEELFEVVTWMQLGLHHKPTAIINISGYYSPMLLWLQHCANEGFVHQRYLDHVVVSPDPVKALEHLAGHGVLPHLFHEEMDTQC